MRNLVFVALIIVGFAIPSAQATDQTVGPAEQQLRTYIDVFNSGERAGVEKFFQENYPSFPARGVNGVMWRRSYTGGFILHRIDESTPTTVTALMQEKDTDAPIRGQVEVEATEPHRITRMIFPIIAMPPEIAPKRLSESQLLSALKEKLTAKTAHAGTVMIARKGKILFSGAYGLADREKKIPNTLDTRFRIGSMNKMFTATAILQLVQAGKIDLNAALGTYLPDYANSDIATKVTIHQLLTHTGGTGDFFGPEFVKHRLELRSIADFIALYGTRGPSFEPGTRFEYSNYGMILLGAVIEKVTGASYYDYVRDHVYMPAGMTHSGSEPEDVIVPNRSIGYTRTDAAATLGPNFDTLSYRGTPAGGGYSTVGDLVAFATALSRHKLLTPSFTELLTTGKIEYPGESGLKYAYGFEDGTNSGARAIGHAGGAPGMNGDLRIYPDSGYVVAVLANMDPVAAQLIAGFIGYRLPLGR
jgi:CubicO group peptidase (beta-lactamase class C family)